MVKLKCPECGSAQIQTVQQGTVRWCRHCGHRGQAPVFEVKKEKRLIYYTAQELAELKALRQKLSNARAHSHEAVSLGREIVEKNRRVVLRNRGPEPT